MNSSRPCVWETGNRRRMHLLPLVMAVSFCLTATPPSFCEAAVFDGAARSGKTMSLVPSSGERRQSTPMLKRHDDVGGKRVRGYRSSHDRNPVDTERKLQFFADEFIDGIFVRPIRPEDIPCDERGTLKTCSPTPNPTLAPTKNPTPQPTPAPTLKATPQPTPAPTSKPTSQPTQAPSSSPTPPSPPTSMPTPAPTPQPTLAPTRTTQPSANPTAQPSSRPTDKPTDAPTDTPTVSPTGPPTAKPSSAPSNMPTKVPSGSPTMSMQPSSAPSDVPSSSPSDLPSAMPSISMQPTVKTFEEIEATATNEDGTEEITVESKCLNAEVLDEKEDVVKDTLNYQYKVNVAAGTDTAQVVASLEKKIQKAMSFHFLTCDLMEIDDGRKFLFVLVDSAPVDRSSMSATCSNEDAIDGTQCVVVDGGTGIELFYPFNRRRSLQGTSVAPEIRTEVGTFLSDLFQGDILIDPSIGIAGVSFEGFTGVNGDGTITVEPDPFAAAGAQSTSYKKRDNPAPIIGGLAVGGAALALIVVGFFVFKRKKRESAEVLEYAKHLDDLSTDGKDDDKKKTGADLNETISSGDEDRNPRVLIDEDVEFGYESSMCSGYFIEDDFEVDPEEHDSRFCASATCPICKSREVDPVFISTVTPEELSASLQEDLGPKRYRSYDTAGSSDHSSSPDTVNL